jgi:lipid II:glycine glycyltransferase (peptidoglycan interpeptide bridge formation enzyme)
MKQFPDPPDPQRWDRLITSLPNAHFLQTGEWAKVKETVGWRPFYIVWCHENNQFIRYINSWPEQTPVVAASLVLQRELKAGKFSARVRVLYSPKGPLLDWSDQLLVQHVLSDLQLFTKQQGAIFIKIDPDVLIGTGIPGTSEERANQAGIVIQQYLADHHWRFSNDQIQFRNTILVDLTGSENDLLNRMKPKTRYNIRLATRKGVSVRHATAKDYPLLYQMYAETSSRDRFIIRDENYYQQVWNIFNWPAPAPTTERPAAYPLIAEVEDQPVAALIVFTFSSRAWYVYGMSSNSHREKMPNHLLQWQAMLLAREKGCQTYDLWGAPGVFTQSDPLWGVYRFKEGLGGEVHRFIGAWDYPPSPVLYHLYSKILPGVLSLARKKKSITLNH